MSTTLTDTDGKTFTYKDGVVYVTDKPTGTPDPEADAQHVLGPYPLTDAGRVIRNPGKGSAAQAMLYEVINEYPDELDAMQKALDEATEDMGPSITTVFQECLDRCDGAVDYALVEIFNSFEKVFPGCKVEVTLPGEDAA